MIVHSAITAFLSGAAVLVIEMTATRALAPHFGQANFVWTNVIGLVLLGLAAGAVIGGRLADRYPRPSVLAGVLLTASVLVAISGFLPAPVSRAILPEELPLEASYDFLLKGSFVATLICFFPPVLLLGAVAPFLVRTATDDLNRLGASSGVLYGASTLGSILGTFLTTYWLLPTFGVRASLMLAAGILALSAVPLIRKGPVHRPVSAMILAAAAIGLSMVPAVQAPAKGAALGTPLAIQDSEYQHIEILRRDDLSARVLALDEGHDSYHSVLPDEGVLTGGYYDYFNVLAANQVEDETLRVLILGFAGGTHARQLLHYFGDLQELSIVGVEIDPVVVELCRKHLGLPTDPRVEIHSDLDARTYLSLSPREFDLIIVDCYSSQSYLPAHLSSTEFFELAKLRLKPEGVLAANLSGYGGRDPVIRAVSGTMATALNGPVVACRLPATANILVYGSKTGDPRLPPELELTPHCPNDVHQLKDALCATLGYWRVAPNLSEPIRDDSGLLDRMQERRLQDRASSVFAGPSR